jgi:hypothetical protein
MSYSIIQNSKGEIMKKIIIVLLILTAGCQTQIQPQEVNKIKPEHKLCFKEPLTAEQLKEIRLCVMRELWAQKQLKDFE